MKTSILLLALIVVALSSCTTAYKTGQTPDDVYYSPVRPQDEYVRMEREDDRSYRYEEDFYEDRYLRMKVRNRGIILTTGILTNAGDMAKISIMAPITILIIHGIIIIILIATTLFLSIRNTLLLTISQEHLT